MKYGEDAQQNVASKFVAPLNRDVPQGQDKRPAMRPPVIGQCRFVTVEDERGHVGPKACDVDSSLRTKITGKKS